MSTNQSQPRRSVLLIVLLASAFAVLASVAALYVGLAGRGGGEPGAAPAGHPPIAGAPGTGAAPGSAAPSAGGQAKEAMGPLDVAAEKLAKRLEASGGTPVEWELLGRTYVEIGRPADAVKAYEKALAGRPGDAKITAALAAAKAKAGAAAK